MDYIQIGYNFRMPSMNAALGIAQLSKIEEIISLRRKIGKYYDKKLDKILELELVCTPSKYNLGPSTDE